MIAILLTAKKIHVNVMREGVYTCEVGRACVSKNIGSILMKETGLESCYETMIYI